jgi:hypothetical protein
MELGCRLSWIWTFDDILEPYAQKLVPIREFEKQYLQQFIIDTNLDDYFVLIEVWSGHDYYQSIDENALI